VAPEDVGEAQRYLDETSRFWRNWIDGGKLPQHPWKEHLQRSALTLKGLTYAPTGALLAAATTSLPENLGGSRNWDYRFTWIRDTAFALRALHSLGFETEADDFLNFLGDVLEPRSRGALDAPDPGMQVLYPVDGSANALEVELDHLTGYAASRPVRVGNAAFDQTQIDIYGAIVDCVFEHARSRDTLTERSWRIVMRSVEAALENWRAPDRGIWEVRGEEKHFTFSKVMCWVAVDRGARLAQMRGDRSRAARWRSAANEIHADICENGVNDDGVFVQAYGSDELDASLLQLPMLGFLPLDDERLRATVFEIDNFLADGACVYRYEAHEADDGLGGEPEHTFTACSFWLVSAFVMIGELDLARSHCEKLIGAASALGLYAEELDPVTLRHFGNFPQGLTHLALINAVLRVITAENEFNETLDVTPMRQRWWLDDTEGPKIVGPGERWPTRGDQ
jgi:alpha,alpha-trehalase